MLILQKFFLQTALYAAPRCCLQSTFTFVDLKRQSQKHRHSPFLKWILFCPMAVVPATSAATHTPNSSSVAMNLSKYDHYIPSGITSSLQSTKSLCPFSCKPAFRKPWSVLMLCLHPARWRDCKRIFSILFLVNSFAQTHIIRRSYFLWPSLVISKVLRLIRTCYIIL